MMVRVLESAYGIPKTEVEKAYIKLGDLGDVAFELSTNKKASNLEISEVHTMLVSIAESEGAGSQETKVRKASDLLKKLDNLTAKFVTRMILGTTRLGFTELTIIDAISQSTT
jgi:DNA ligase-1